MRNPGKRGRCDCGGKLLLAGGVFAFICTSTTVCTSDFAILGTAGQLTDANTSTLHRTIVPWAVKCFCPCTCSGDFTVSCSTIQFGIPISCEFSLTSTLCTRKITSPSNGTSKLAAFSRTSSFASPDAGAETWSVWLTFSFANSHTCTIHRTQGQQKQDT